MNAISKLNQLLSAGCRKDARKHVNACLKNDPDNHWLITSLAEVYYEHRLYKQAKILDEKALCLAPHCPLVLWNYASDLDMMSDTNRAVYIWQHLLKRGVSSIAFGKCGEGKRWAESLLNDCRYRLALAFAGQKQWPRAKRYMRSHLSHRRAGLPSIYTKAEAMNYLQRMNRDETYDKMKN